MNKIPILILTGPTAVGKTNLSVKLAKVLNGEIISADATQVYKKMDVGSAKVTLEEMDGVKHHLIDVVEPDEDFSVSEFCRLSREAIGEIHSRGKLPIITGGTGLYINSILYNMDFGKNDSNDEIRKELQKIYDDNGAEYLHNLLRDLDDETASRIHPNNVKRVIRAIEIIKLGGKLGDFSTDLKYNEDYDPKIVILNRDRNVLYERINLRVDIMFDSGLLEEVHNLLDSRYGRDLVSMKAIGYKEVVDYINGEITLDECKEIIKQSTRRYAKRQITWFKRYKNAEWIDLDIIDNLDEQIKLVREIVEG